MERYLPDCLDSLIQQDIPINDYEIIVVNDGSQDSTLEIAMGYQKKFSNIHIIDKKNAGVGAARNTGLDKARGTYVYFLDPDDFILENVLGILLKTLDEYQLDILTFNTQTFKSRMSSKAIRPKNKSTPINVVDGITYISQNKYRNEVWWFITNREFLLKSEIRFLEGRWMEDAILTAKLFCVARRMTHLDIDVHRYRIVPTSAMRNKSPKHYKKVIYDNASVAREFQDLMESLPKTHEAYSKACQRLKTRQQSFVFFLMVRLMKSDISIHSIPQMLSSFKEIDAYPLNRFLGPDYHGIRYSFLVFIFNNKSLINPFFKVFRIFYTFVR